MLNTIAISGRLTETPELRATTSGQMVTTFGVAVERDYKGKDGSKLTDFFDVVAWKNTAEFICKYFTKGSPIIVKGELQSRKYLGADGKNHTVIEIIASSVYFCGSASGAGAQNQRNNTVATGGGTFSAAPQQTAFGFANDDELPF